MSANEDSSISLEMKIFICGDTHNNTEIGHAWDGPVVKIENGETITCSKCGVGAYEWGIWHLS